MKPDLYRDFSSPLRVAVFLVVLTVFVLGTAWSAQAEVCENPDISPGDIVDDLPPLTGVPDPGLWNFKMDVGQPGQVPLQRDPAGLTVTIIGPTATWVFTNSSILPPYTYTTNTMTYQNLDSSGSIVTQGVYYVEFTAVDSDCITGQVFVTNTTDGNSLVRSFFMTLPGS